MPTRTSNVIRPIKPHNPYRAEIALAHAAVIFVGFGILIAGLVWYSRRRESDRVAFQAGQAVLWQVVLLLLTLVVNRVTSGILLAGLIGDLLSGSGGETSTLALICAHGLTALVVVPFIAGGLTAAAVTWQGGTFRYPLIADWLENWLQD